MALSQAAAMVSTMGSNSNRRRVCTRRATLNCSALAAEAIASQSTATSIELQLAVALQPAEVCRCELERGAVLSKCGEGVTVKIAQRSRRQPVQVTWQAVSVSMERVRCRAMRDVMAQQPDGLVDERATLAGWPCPAFDDFNIRRQARRV